MSHKGNDDGNEYAYMLCQDLATTIKIARRHETYVSKSDLVMAIIDGFGPEAEEIANIIIETCQQKKA
jgi:hypothetical protein